jgi:hypothetical protein
MANNCLPRQEKDEGKKRSWNFETWPYSNVLNGKRNIILLHLQFRSNIEVIEYVSVCRVRVAEVHFKWTIENLSICHSLHHETFPTIRSEACDTMDQPYNWKLAITKAYTYQFQLVPLFMISGAWRYMRGYTCLRRTGKSRAIYTENWPPRPMSRSRGALPRDPQGWGAFSHLPAIRRVPHSHWTRRPILCISRSGLKN